MSVRNYSNTAQTSTLATAVGATDTALALVNYVGDPTPPFTAALARGTAAEEVVLVTAVAGSTVTVTRGYDATSAQAHGAGTTFQEVVVAQDFREANTHVNAVSGVHGLGAGSAVVGTTDIQTLSGKSLTAPTISNPTVTGTAAIAAATVSGTLAVAGAVTLSGTATVLAPVNPTDAATKAYVDTATAAGVSAATPNTPVKRDASGRAQFADPSAAADAATKNYVDTQIPAVVGGDTGWVDLGTAAGWAVRAGLHYRVKHGVTYVSGDLTRTGGDVAPGGPNTIATLPSVARPNGFGWFADAATVNVQYGEIQFSSTGAIWLWGSIASGQVLTFSAAFPSD